MSERVNAFEASARALADVRDLVIRGQDLQKNLERIAAAAEKSSSSAASAAKAATTPISEAALSASVVISKAGVDVESALASLTKAASDSVERFNSSTDSAVRRVVAEIASAQQRIEKSAHDLAATAAQDSTKIERATKRVARSSRGLLAQLKSVEDRLAGLADAYEKGVVAVGAAEVAVRAVEVAVQAERAAAMRAGAELFKAVGMLQRMRVQVVVMWLTLIVAIVAVRL